MIVTLNILVIIISLSLSEGHDSKMVIIAPCNCSKSMVNVTTSLATRLCYYWTPILISGSLIQ